MARILIAWELGRGLGHIVPMVAVALEARRLGHEVVLALPRGRDSQGWLARTGSTVTEVDLAVSPARSFPLSINYSANLLRNGYWHVDTVRARVHQWCRVIDDVRPDAVVAEHAPGVLLASRGAAITRVVMGNGFAQPPLRDPMRPLQAWLPVPDARLRAIDEHWLSSVNAALGERALPPLAAVQHLFDDATRLLTIEAELDHYSDRSDGTFVGAMEPPSQFTLPALPAEVVDGFVFVYVSASNRYLAPILAALDTLEWPVVAYVPGLPREVASQHPGVVWLPAPVDVGSLAHRCRLVVTAGGSMLGSQILKHGLPWFVCPEDLEKAVMGLQVARRGLAHSLNWFAPMPVDLADRLRRAAESSPSPQRLAFVTRYRGGDNAWIAGKVIEACCR